jgi:hypothetical protein
VTAEPILDGGLDHRRNDLVILNPERRDPNHPRESVRRVVLNGTSPKEAKMKRAVIYAGLLAALISPLAALTTAAAQSSPNSDTNAVNVSGRVSCSRFGRGSITARKGMSVAQTIWYCATFQGGQYTLVSGNRIYALSGDPKQLAKMAGQTVTVAGHMVPVPPDTAAVAFMGTVSVTEVVPTKE